MNVETYPVQKEQFEVVMLKSGVNEMVAVPADFKRVPVVAENPLAAMMSADVEAVKGFRPLCATRPGILIEPEVHARRREVEGPAIDRSKI